MKSMVKNNLLVCLCSFITKWYLYQNIEYSPCQKHDYFLFGLMWIWTGLSLICRINPYYAQKYERRHQFLFDISSVGMGISWNIISLTHLSNQAIPMILISSPFLISDLIIFLRYKK